MTDDDDPYMLRRFGVWFGKFRFAKWYVRKTEPLTKWCEQRSVPLTLLLWYFAGIDITLHRHWWSLLICTFGCCVTAYNSWPRKPKAGPVLEQDL